MFCFKSLLGKNRKMYSVFTVYSTPIRSCDSTHSWSLFLLYFCLMKNKCNLLVLALTYLELSTCCSLALFSLNVMCFHYDMHFGNFRNLNEPSINL